MQLSAVYYAKNRDKYIERKRQWREANPEKIKQYSRFQYKKHYTKIIEKMTRRYARIRGNKFEKYSFADIVLRDKNICWICKQIVEKKDESRDHLIPIANGGPDILWNVALAHRRCNIKRGRGNFPAGYILSEIIMP